MLTPPREAFQDDDTVLIDVHPYGGPGGPEVDALGRAHFEAFWRTDQGWVPGGVRAQCFWTNLQDWMDRNRAAGRYVSKVAPCSFPGCGKPTAYMPVRQSGSVGMQWRHVFPADEVMSHVGYPMDRSEPAEVTG